MQKLSSYKTLRAKQSARYYKKHKKKINDKTRERRYGLSKEQHAQLLITQQFVCAVCSELKPKLWVDHDHVTNVVRGLLCPGCNTALGAFKDDPALLTAAISYLQNPPANAI
jgi:hypothetical protein